jgi:AraC-like DNA-binding protein
MSKAKGSFLRLGADRGLFQGHLPVTSWHKHAAPVLLVGLSGDFGVHLRDGTTETCRSALIDADIEHIFDPRGEQLAAIYLEPDAPEVRGLRAAFLKRESVAFNIAKVPGQRGCFDRHLAQFDLGAVLKYSFADVVTPNLDARIARSLPLLRTHDGEPIARATLAQQANLSESRFNHLFSAEMGVSFRRYRSWSLLRSALLHLPRSRSFTDAALNGGFVDSAHFSHVFRDMFGLTPSAVLKNVVAFEVL